MPSENILHATQAEVPDRICAAMAQAAADCISDPWKRQAKKQVMVY